MKQKLYGFVVLALGLIFCASAQASLVIAEGKATGQWYNPERDGEGFYVEVIDSGDTAQLGIAMYSFDDSGKQLWIVGNAPVSATATTVTVTMFQVEGPVWGSGFDPGDKVNTEFGTITARFTSCNTALFQVRPTAGFEPGDYPAVRLTNVVGIECVDPPPKPPEGGVEAEEWGNGVTLCMNVDADGRTLTPENSPCPEGASIYIDRTGIFIANDGDIKPDLCVTQTWCSGPASINSQGNFQCTTDGGLIEGFFTSATTMYGFGYVAQPENGGVCASEWDMVPR